jgi:hypothetical protein
MFDHSVTPSSDGVVITYHQYLMNMDCLSSGEAKRRWRKAIKDAWDNRCAFCDCPPISDQSLTIDHMRPRSKGGEDISRNCVPACLEHNQSKGSNDWQPWFRSQSFYSVEREARIVFWLRHSRVPNTIELDAVLRELSNNT